MPHRVYDRWPHFVGQHLKVIIGDQEVAGTFLGPQPMLSVQEECEAVEPPWALATDDGGIEYLDPDNPGVHFYVDGKRLDELPTPPSLAIRETTVESFLERVKQVLDRTSTRVNQVVKHAFANIARRRNALE